MPIAIDTPEVDRDSTAAVLACLVLLCRKTNQTAPTFAERAKAALQELQLGAGLSLDFNSDLFAKHISCKASPALHALNTDQLIVGAAEARQLVNWNDIAKTAFYLTSTELSLPELLLLCSSASGN